MNMPAAIDAPSFKRDPALSIARAAVAAAMARIDRSATAAEHATKAWPFDREAQLLTRAATAPLDSTSLAALVQVAAAILPMLTPYSAAARLFSAGLEVTFTREAGAYTIPGLSQAAVAFVAEGAPKPAVQALSNAARIDPHKIAGITVVSSELFGQPSIEPIMQTLLAEAAGPALDAVVFSDLAGNAAHPPGLLNGIAPLTASTGGSGSNKTDALLDDLKTLVAALGPVAGATPIIFVANPLQVVGADYRLARALGNFFPSGAVPVGTVIGVAVSALVSATGVPEFTTATHATIHMNDVPLPIVDGAGVVSPGVRSMFQTASVAIKMEMPATWALRAPNAVAYIEGVAW